MREDTKRQEPDELTHPDASGMEELSDEDLEEVAGGWDGTTPEGDGG